MRGQRPESERHSLRGIHKVSHTVRTIADAGCSAFWGTCSIWLLSLVSTIFQSFFQPISTKAHTPPGSQHQSETLRLSNKSPEDLVPFTESQTQNPHMIPYNQLSVPKTQTPTTAPVPALIPSGLTASCPHIKTPLTNRSASALGAPEQHRYPRPSTPMGQHQPKGPWCHSLPCPNSTTPTSRLAATTQSSSTKVDTRPTYQRHPDSVSPNTAEGHIAHKGHPGI